MMMAMKVYPSKIKEVKMLQFPSLGGCCNISHFTTTRHGGVSKGPFASLNFGRHSGDDIRIVWDNFRILSKAIDLPLENIYAPRQVHDEVEMQTLLAPIVQVCDAISGARPGARREVVEAYIKRLNDLEQLALSYPGVVKTYAIQAGRELRVIVGADKIDDKETENLSNEIAKKIQDEMTYPGQVKITVIRETRAVSYAK